MTMTINEIQPYWTVMSPVLSVQDEESYDQAVDLLNQLIDEVGTNESDPLYDLLDTLGTLIHAYEEKHMQIPNVSGIEALTYLMEEHQLRQSDLPEIGSQGVVSEILNGKRTLNVRQIRALAERFQVSPTVFL